MTSAAVAASARHWWQLKHLLSSIKFLTQFCTSSSIKYIFIKYISLRLCVCIHTCHCVFFSALNTSIPCKPSGCSQWPVEGGHWLSHWADVQLVPPHQDQALQAETTHCLLSKQSWGETLPTVSADAGTLQLLLKSNLITAAEEFFSILSGSFTVLPHSPLCLLSLSQYLPF